MLSCRAYTPPKGESNALADDPEASYYLCALPFLVSSLRTVFNSPNMHVSVIQLAPWARWVKGLQTCRVDDVGPKPHRPATDVLQQYILI